MKRSRLPLHALRAFEAAAECKSLAQAAEVLSVTHAAISHHIRGLEDQLGVVLFDRSKRPMKLTDAGDRLLEAVRDGLDRISLAVAELKGPNFAGSILVASVPGLGANWLPDILGEYILMYPNVKVRLVTRSWIAQEPAEEADLAITFGSADQAGRRVTWLGQPEMFPVCSPRLPLAHQKKVHPKDLTEHTMLHEHNSDTWGRWFISCGIPPCQNHRGIFFDGAHLALQGARAGAGLAMADMPTVAGDLRDGRLVRLTNFTIPLPHPYYVSSLPADRAKPAALALESLIVERFGKFN